uniref:uncharacterized protein LOC109955215 n=1 Tax=Monopterus albus TaxID=43700 RepID=UPI0009B3C97D|nr:uncharacterized protein LOC109955215 [Monopterus albus]
MGSGTSRGKKVAPACVSEVNMSKTTVTASKQDSHPFKPLRIHAILRNARNRAPPDRHGEGHDSDFSREGDSIDRDLDTVLADYEKEKVSAKKTAPMKTIMKSKTYGLCHFSREDTEEDVPSTPRLREPERAEEPRGSRSGPGDVNKRNNDAFTHFKTHTSECTSHHNSFLSRGTLLEAVPTSEKQSQPRRFGSCHSSSLTMPVILYDGSEEELMDTIEREFS